MQHGTIDKTAMREALAGLIKAASREGHPDRYAGKRHSTRFSEGLLLELTTDPDRSGGRQNVHLHNISPEGFAFWCRAEIRAHTVVHLRPFAEGEPNPWVAGRVTHCTRGLRGFLVGGRFELDADSD